MSVQHMGIICKDIYPGVGGDMRLIRGSTPQDTKILIYQSDTPAPTRFKKVPLPKTDEEWKAFEPTFEEAWMGDPGQSLNHESNRLVISDLKGNYKVLFHEYGQTGWWWTSPNLQKIHILTNFLDFTKDDSLPNSSITQMRLFTSFDGGQTFRENVRFRERIGTGYGSGMVFDATGNVGYVFVDRNIVWQIIDGGLKFRKHFIPHTTLTPFPTGESIDGLNKDAAMVDNHRNLLYALFEPMEGDRAGANIYEIGETETRTDLVQDRPRYSFPGKRVIAMSRIPGREGFYMFYVECGNDRNFTYYDTTDYSREEIRAHNPPLHFARVDQDGRIVSSHKFSFFLKIKTINVEDNGDIGVSADMNVLADARMMVSHDYGDSWHGLDTTSFSGIAADHIDLKRKEYWVDSQNMANDLNNVYRYDLSSIK